MTMERTVTVVAVCMLALFAPSSDCTRGEDFVFDNSDEIQIDAKTKSNELQRVGSTELKRLWGIPDMTAYVGHLFRMEIPDEAFNQDIAAYKVKSVSRRRAPEWLAVDSKHGLLRGVPTYSDIGTHTLSVTAYGHKAGQTATDTFTIEVKNGYDIPRQFRESCPMNADRMDLVMLVDANFHRLTSKQRTRALMELSKFMAVPEESFRIESYKPQRPSEQTTLLMSGSGETRTKTIDGATAIYLTVGCNNKMWQKHKLLVHQLGGQAKDGTLAHVLQLPTLGWRLVNVKPLVRARRQLPEESSAYYDEIDYSGDDEDEENDDEDYVMPSVTAAHAHRHHHGEHRDRPALHQHHTSNAPYYPSVDKLPYQTPYLPSNTPRTSPYNPYIPRQSPTVPPYVMTPHNIPATHPYSKPVFPYSKPFYPTTIQANNYFLHSANSSKPGQNSINHSAVAPKQSTQHQSMSQHHLSTIPYKYPTTPPNSTTISYFPPSFHYQSPTIQHTSIVPRNTSKVTSTATSTPTLLQSFVPTNPSPSEGVLDNLTKPSPPSKSYSASTTILFLEPTSAATEQSSVKEFLVPVPSTHQSNSVTDSNEAESTDKKLLITPTNDSTTDERKLLFSPVQTSDASTARSTTNSVSVLTIPTPRTETTVSSVRPSQVTLGGKANVSTVTTTPAMTIDDFLTTTTENTGLDTIVFGEVPPISSTGRTSTISGQTTETIDFPLMPNQPPTLNHHMKKLAVTAGKAFRYIIPSDLFSDAEDGNNLNYTMLEADGRTLKPSSWVQFIPENREVYGLPLNEHASRWNYIIEVSDRNGAKARAPLDITVQQHKGLRTATKEFDLQLELVKPFSADVNWQIKVLEALVNVLRDSDMNNLTVRNVSTNGNVAVFVWTNDSLPKDNCQSGDIEQILSILQLDNTVAPSAALSRELSPTIRPLAVKSRSTGACTDPVTPAPAPAPPAPPAENFAPVIRNQVDHLHVYAGQLLVFTVPEDAFFDPEDGSTRQLSLRVYTGNRVPLPNDHWLQFDVNNQEFYGLPLPGDVGRQQYQLIAEDSGGKTAIDALIVEVEAPPSVRHNVEFSIVMDINFESFATNARQKRAFIERLYTLFGDKNADNISIRSIIPKPTTVIWYNTSLPTDHCPNEAIEQLKRVVSEESGATLTLSQAVERTFGSDFNVMSVKQEPLGLCLPNSRSGSSDFIGGNAGPAPEPEKADDYLLTFIIPLAAVVGMILLAGLIAILLRRRRAHKLNLGDELERTAFRTRGIPVIFQDELDDRVEARQAAPLIMQAEKPPLAPSPRAPYRAPPPLASSATARLPPAPHYRKPPPYVPP